MQSSLEEAAVGKKSLWAGRILSALPALMLASSAVMKFIKPAAVVEGFARFGYPENLIVMLGVVEMLCAVIYVIPRTAFLGAILMTGYLGGATATNVRVGDPTFFVPVLLGVLAWGGLYLRDARVRALVTNS
jgi:DoxX-like protein